MTKEITDERLQELLERRPGAGLTTVLSGTGFTQYTLDRICLERLGMNFLAARRALQDKDRATWGKGQFISIKLPRPRAPGSGRPGALSRHTAQQGG